MLILQSYYILKIIDVGIYGCFNRKERSLKSNEEQTLFGVTDIDRIYKLLRE